MRNRQRIPADRAYASQGDRGSENGWLHLFFSIAYVLKGFSRSGSHFRLALRRCFSRCCYETQKARSAFDGRAGEKAGEPMENFNKPDPEYDVMAISIPCRFFLRPEREASGGGGGVIARIRGDRQARKRHHRANCLGSSLA